jgi:hypothetical protein
LIEQTINAGYVMQLNPSKPFMGIFATMVFLYLLYTLLATDPLERMNRICTPFFIWPQKVIVSGLDIFAPASSPAVAQKFDNGFNLCRRWVWGAFYEKDYERLKMQMGGA